MGNRNEQIAKSLENESIPVLPFELTIAKNALASHVDKQSELGRTMGEMMQQSSETWHDNAPAEAIMHDSKILASTAEKTIRVLQNAEVFEYGNDDTSITLGSLVGVKYGNDTEVVQMLLTGVSRELPDETLLEALVDEGTDFQCVTLSSPVGRAIFNKTAGDVVSIEVSGRNVKLTIVDVKQFSEE